MELSPAQLKGRIKNLAKANHADVMETIHFILLKMELDS